MVKLFNTQVRLTGPKLGPEFWAQLWLWSRLWTGSWFSGSRSWFCAGSPWESGESSCESACFWVFEKLLIRFVFLQNEGGVREVKRSPLSLTEYLQLSLEEVAYLAPVFIVGTLKHSTYLYISAEPCRPFSLYTVWAACRCICSRWAIIDLAFLFVAVQHYNRTETLFCIVIGQEPLSVIQLWRMFRSLRPDFISSYAAYHHFRSRGWVPKGGSGAKYGVDFSKITQETFTSVCERPFVTLR